MLIIFSVHLWAPMATQMKSSYWKLACPLCSVSRPRKESVSLLIWTQDTIKLSSVNLLPLGSYLLRRFPMNVGLNLYPICSSACLSSGSSIYPDLSPSILSNNPIQSLIYLNKDPNSWTLMFPVLFRSNISIIILQASSLKLLQFPLTSALCSSRASICPLLS